MFQLKRKMSHSVSIFTIQILKTQIQGIHIGFFVYIMCSPKKLLSADLLLSELPNIDIGICLATLDI